MSEKVKILIGADPELFARDAENKPVSVHDLLPGTKASPLKVPYGGIQVDGIAAEFNIEPASCRKDFLRNIQHVRNLLEFILKERRSDLTLECLPTVYLNREMMNSLPDDARRLGCEPDYNAYTGKMNPKPSQAALFRTAAGHVHVGWGEGFKPFEDNHFQTCRNLTKELDFVVYRASHQWDKDTTRMQLYGKPGAFRPKPYGLEYRVLSNAWLRSTILQQYVYDATRAVSENFFKGNFVSLKWGKDTIEPEEYSSYYNLLERNRIPVISNYAFSSH